MAQRKLDALRLRREVEARRGRKPPPPPKPTPFMRKVSSLMRAVSGPRASEDVYQARLALCRACEYLKADGSKEYCGACGCGKWKLAQLSVKLKFAQLECPAGKWGASS